MARKSKLTETGRLIVPNPVAGVATVKRLPVPPDGSIRLRSATFEPTQTTALLNAPVIPGGYGGYGAVARPGRIGLLTPQGRDPSTLAVSMEWDRRALRGSVDGDLRSFNRLAGDEQLAMPLVVEGRGIPHAFHLEPAGRWVIGDDVTFDAETQDVLPGRHGAICYQQVTFTLHRLPEVDPDAIDDAAERSEHTVRKNSELKTLTRIAKHYGTSWFRLRMLNPKLPADPNKDLPVNTIVRLQ